MNLKKILTYISLFLISFGVFAGGNPAAKYNDHMIKRQHKVVKGFMKMYDTFEKGTKEEMLKEHSRLLVLVNQSIDEIKALTPYEGDSDFKNAALELFTFYKSSLDNEYPKMIALIAIRDRSKEDHKKLDDYRDDLVKREKMFDDKFEDAQITFSKKHDLKLIHPKM